MSNFDNINKAVENLDIEHIMNLMRSLIRIDTSVPPGSSYREYVDTISPYFGELGFSIEQVIIPEEIIKNMPYPLEGPRINLVATKDYDRNKYITFYGHMDVVPAINNGKKKWRFPPFEATLTKNGRIYGRGTADMKGSMVCLILAMQLINKLNFIPKYNIRILNCTDEEVGMNPGVRYLAEKGYIKGTMFCMDGVIIPLIPIGTAGDLNIVIETIGKSCHSGRNFLGINALEELIPILNELIKLKKKVEKRRSKDIPGDPRDVTGKNLRPMFSLVIIKSGEKENIIPGHCQLIINRRIIPDENYEHVKQEILEAIEKGKSLSKALQVNTTFNYDTPPLKVNPHAPAIKRWKKTIALVENIDEDNIQVIGSSESTDMGFIAQNLNIDDIIITGVESAISNTHGINEFVRLRDIKTLIKEIIVFLCYDF
ncbi:MAG: ArgE/DapE family deacylase [Promethearchaeota archaeon]|nr:MAG: ArgE/DapE family deacylase [Candidatus Lokiarchaeota archaeon]